MDCISYFSFCWSTKVALSHRFEVKDLSQRLGWARGFIPGGLPDFHNKAESENLILSGDFVKM